jgi:hypothetical protein
MSSGRQRKVTFNSDIQPPRLPGMKKIYLPPPPDLGGLTKDDYKNSPLMYYSLAKEKQKEVQKLV